MQAQYTDDYTFKTLTDDGVRLWVNGALVIDNWTDHGPTTDSAPTVAMVAGQKYNIVMEYFENGGDATAKLMWAGDYQPEEAIPTTQLYPEEAPTPLAGTGTGLAAQYFDGQDLSDLVAAREESQVGNDWGGGSPDAAVPTDHFSARWSGQVQPRYSGTYTFYTQSDDGVRLWVGGQLLVDNWTDHGTTEDSGTITLTAGQKYDIVMEYFENGGDATAKLLWSSNDQVKEVVPSTQLYPAPFVGVLETADAGEGDDLGWFLLWRGGADLSAPLTVNYTLGGEASSSDYTVSGTPGQVTFPAGEAAAYVDISRVAGRPDADGLGLTLTISAGASYAASSGPVTLYLFRAPVPGTSSVSVTGTNTHFNLTNATAATLTDGTVKAGTTDVTVTAYTGGKLDAKIDDPVFAAKFPANPSGISLVATSSSAAVVGDLKWLQFNMRTATFEPNTNQTYFISPKLDASLKGPFNYYYGRDEWVVDSSTPNSAIHAQARAAAPFRLKRRTAFPTVCT